MKFLAVGDIHGDVDLAREMAERASKEKVDFVVICGDISSFDENIEGIVGLFKQKVFLVPGNHDSEATIDFLAQMYKGKNLEGYGYKIGDVGLFGCGSVNLGMFQKTERDIFDTLKKGADYVKDCSKRVLVSHVHPSNSKMEQFGWEGSQGLKKAIDEFKPDFVLCSHLHEAEGIEEMIGNSKVINVGRKGKIIKI
ncbi:MAG: metallophosphoesterase [archaeon]